MRNLSRITNYWNRVEAWRDWKAIADRAEKNGHADLVEKYKPAENASWRKIDSAIEKLREAMKDGETWK